MKERLFYKAPPPRSTDGGNHEFEDDDLVWQLHSLPLGCGYFGACVYGYTDTERIQLTDNSFANPYLRPQTDKPTRCRCGLTSFANIYLHFGHSEVSDYYRELDLGDGVCRVGYKSGGVSYKREYFTSYPDRAMCVRLTAEGGRISVGISANIPYVGDYCHCEGDGLSRSGSVTVDGDMLRLESRLDYYGVVGYGVLKIIHTCGKIHGTDGTVYVSDADEVVLLYTMGTNYRMESRVFTEPDPLKKLAPYPHPKKEVNGRISELEALGYTSLLARHLVDYRALFDRAHVRLGADYCPAQTTDSLVRAAKNGQPPDCLISLLFAYGRYLLIASSRVGALPCNLQGVWSNYRSSPWSSGYWHNINVQMNYWPSGIANLAECFLSYSDYNSAYMDSARSHADSYVKNFYPERASTDGDNGWIIGTGAWPYRIDSASWHSGPGTGAFTSLLFWDYYDYTRDEEYLRTKAYPVLRDMSLFFSRTLTLIDGKYLVERSASPEQCGSDGEYYQTVGCAFDQEMVYENYKRTLEAAQILGIEEPLLDVIREQIDLLDPVIIGESGQIKEFREERLYGDIGEYRHRHVSHLVALYPGTAINSSTPELCNAARYTLNERGDGSSGWSAMHRLGMWARLGDGKRAYDVIRYFLSSCIPDNLWDQHPPFQIDGNLGFTACVAEMLLQSHEGYIKLLPALPEEWTSGEFSGLVARGSFVVDCRFENSRPTYAKIYSRAGGRMSLLIDGSARLVRRGTCTTFSHEIASIDTNVGDTVEVYFN